MGRGLEAMVMPLLAHPETLHPVMGSTPGNSMTKGARSMGVISARESTGLTVHFL